MSQLVHLEQSHTKNIASIPTTSMGLADCSVVDRERQTAESVTGFVESSMQDVSLVVRFSVNGNCLLRQFQTREVSLQKSSEPEPQNQHHVDSLRILMSTEVRESLLCLLTKIARVRVTGIKVTSLAPCYHDTRHLDL